MVSSHSVLLGLIGILLIASVGGANVVVAGQRTVLDADFVTDQLADEEVYGEAESAIQQQLRAQLDNSTGGNLPVPIDAAAVADEAISRPYIRNQTNRNVHRFYSYLHGSADELVLSVDLEPVKESIAASVGDEAATVDVAELVGGQLEDSGSQLPVDAALVEQLTAGPDGYQSARAEFRDRVRDRIVTRMVEAAFQNATNDELLALVIEDYNPDAYSESEKEQMVADREAEIRSAIRIEITDERAGEIDDQVQQALEGYQASLDSQQPDANGNATQGLETAIFDVNRVVVTGFTGDASYEAFQSDLEAAKADLGTAVETLFADRLDQELPATLDLTEEMGSDQLQQFETARSAVSTLDLLAILLPLISLGLISLAYVPGRSVPATATVAGVALVVAGFVGLVGAIVAGDVIANAIRQSVPDDGAIPLGDIALGVVNDVFGTLTTQSILIGIGGIVALAVVVAHRRGHLDRFRERSEGEPAGNEAAGPDEPSPADTEERD